MTESRSRPLIKQHLIPMFDVPSSSVDLALLYCRYPTLILLAL